MINVRLKQARLSKGFKSCSEFARYASIEEGTYRHHENGSRGLTVHALRKYAHVLDVCVCWLLTGEDSENYRKNNSDVNSGVSLNTKDTKTLITVKFLSLSDNEKKETLKTLAGFVHS